MSGATRGREFASAQPMNSEAFAAEYQAALASLTLAPTRKAAEGTLGWLIKRYRESSAWATLAPATRRQRENIFRHVEKAAGDIPFKAITRANIIDGREDRRATPNQANNFIKTMRGLFHWAVDVEKAAVDPTRDVKLLNVKTDGFHVWTDDEVSTFEFALANRNARATGVRSLAAHWPAARRCCSARPPARQGWRVQDSDREKRRHRRGTNHVAVGSVHRSRADRRSRVHCRRGREADDEGVIWQLVQRSLSDRWRSRFGSWPAENRGDLRGGGRGDDNGIEGHVRLDRRRYAGSLHADGRPGEDGSKWNVQARKEGQNLNGYPLTSTPHLKIT